MMSIEQARAIVKAINARCMIHMGLPGELTPLADVSLADMVTAAQMVANANKANKAAAKFSGGQYSISVIPADRLIAAVYALEHFPASNEPILSLPAGGGHQLVIAVLRIANAAETELEAS